MNENGEGAEAPQAGRLRSQRSRGFFSQPRGGSFLVLDVTDTIFSLSPIRLLKSLCAFSCLNHLSEESHVDSRGRRCNCRNIASRSSYVRSLLCVIEGLMIIDSSFSNIETNYLEARKKKLRLHLASKFHGGRDDTYVSVILYAVARYEICRLNICQDVASSSTCRHADSKGFLPLVPTLRRPLLFSLPVLNSFVKPSERSILSTPADAACHDASVPRGADTLGDTLISDSNNSSSRAIVIIVLVRIVI